MNTKQRILSKTSPEKDTLRDRPEKSSKWKKASKGMFPYKHNRPLTAKQAQRAIDYIDVIVKKYPFQIRYAMALPLWYRFADEWCATGNEQEALRAI